MPTEPLTPAFLKKLGTKPEHIGETYRDTKEEGLSVRTGKNGKLSFYIRMSLDNGDRPETSFYKCRPAEVDQERLDKIIELAQDQKREWRKRGVVAEKTGHPLREVLDLATALKRKGDRDIGRRRGVSKTGGLPKEWLKTYDKFRAMCPELLDRPVETITRAEYKACQEREALKQDHARGGSLTKDDYLMDKIKSQRPMWANVIQALDYASDEGWITPKEIKNLVPLPYDPRTRFLLPGEWQIVAPLIDKLPRDGGMMLRFLLATGARLGQALAMKWADIDAIEKIKTPDGQEHDTRLWRIPLQKHNVGLTMLIGDSLAIVNHFKLHRDIEQKAEQEAENERARNVKRESKKIPKRDTVFPAEVISMWRRNASRHQRKLDEKVDVETDDDDIESELGISRWTRHDLRRTKATYSKYVRTSQYHVSKMLSHETKASTATGQDAALVTDRYTMDDAYTEQIGTDDDIDTDDDYSADIALAHLRVQALFRQMERGELSPVLARIQKVLGGVGGVNTNKMRVRYGIHASLIKIKEVTPKAAAAQATQKSGNVVMATMQHEATRSAT